jgi:Cu(I)/Ag(I) efflux system periplasmic protein CusF
VNIEKRLLTLAILCAATIALTTSAFAQGEMVDGQVTKIDQAAGKITLRHGPIKKYDMDGMTMVFRVKDPTMLKQVKVGDKIRFETDKVDGQFTVLKMQKTK